MQIPPEVQYRGYTLKGITLVPAPERLPVECSQPIQSGSERAFDFMAKYGICGVIGGGSAVSFLVRSLRCRRLGWPSVRRSDDDSTL